VCVVERRSKVHFELAFVARLSELLICCVAVWKQLYLNHWFGNANFSRSFVEPVNKPLVSRVAVWKQLRLNLWLLRRSADFPEEGTVLLKSCSVTRSDEWTIMSRNNGRM
jgi:hypothetical protein